MEIKQIEEEVKTLTKRIVQGCAETFEAFQSISNTSAKSIKEEIKNCVTRISELDNGSIDKPNPCKKVSKLRWKSGTRKH